MNNENGRDSTFAESCVGRVPSTIKWSGQRVDYSAMSKNVSLLISMNHLDITLEINTTEQKESKYHK